MEATSTTAQLGGTELREVKKLLGRWLQSDLVKARTGCVLCYLETGKQVSVTTMSEPGRREFALSGVCEPCYGSIPLIIERIPAQLQKLASSGDNVQATDIITLDMASYQWVMICKTRHTLIWDKAILEVLKLSLIHI